MEARPFLPEAGAGRAQADARKPVEDPALFLQGLERAVQAACGAQTFADVLARLQSATSAGSICTAVWPAGAVAYRCKTCQMTPSSAVCVACFKAGNHEGHDYIVYRSGTGGCCDCGDTSAWKEQGCCSRHRPGSSQEVSLRDVVSEAGAVTLSHAAALALVTLTNHITALKDAAPINTDRTKHCEAALEICKWLAKLAASPPVRSEMCMWARKPLTELAAGNSGAAAAAGAASTATAAASAVQQLAAAMATRTQTLLQDAVTTPLNRTDCLGRRLIALIPDTSDPPLQDLTTLLMLLLYDSAFKYETAVHFLDFYSSMLRPDSMGFGAHTTLVPNRALSACLDRITVQLFNTEDITVRLVREEDAFRTIFKTLHRLVDKVFLTMGTSSLRNQETVNTEFMSLFSGYRRALADLHTMAQCPTVGALLLSDTSLIEDQLLLFLGKMQGMAGQTCIPPGHPAAREAHAYVVAAENLELVTLHSVSEIVNSCVTHTVSNADTRLRALAGAARCCMESLVDYSNSQQMLTESVMTTEDALFDYDVRTLYNRMKTGQLPMSPHYPLQRVTALFIKALLTLGDNENSPFTQSVNDTLTSLLQHLAAPTSPPQAPDDATGKALLGDPLCTSQAAVRQLFALHGMLSQVAQRVWVRNGDDAAQLEMAYTTWRDFFQDLDLLMLMAALAAGPQQQLLADWLLALGAGPLLQLAGVSTGQNQPSLTESGTLVDSVSAEDALRAIVSLLRNRVVCGTAHKHRIRTLLVHTLALSDKGHSQLLDALPSDLQQRTEEVDQVLHECATYRPPSLTSPGVYCLKKESWALFDPHMHHITRKTGPRALERAAAAGVWKPHMQLRRPSVPLPHALRPLLRVLEQPLMIQIVSYVVQHYPTNTPPRLSEDLFMSALNLISLQLQYLEDQLDQLQGPTGHSGDAQRVVQALLPMLQGRPQQPTGAINTGVLATLRSIAGESSHTAPHTSHHTLSHGEEVTDCCRYLVTEVDRILGRVRDSGLMPPEYMSATGQQPAAAQRQADAAAAAGAASSAAGAAAGGKPALDAKALAKQRQEAMMAKMRAAQQAFLRAAPTTTQTTTATNTNTPAEHESESDRGTGSESEPDTSNPDNPTQQAAAPAAAAGPAAAGAAAADMEGVEQPQQPAQQSPAARRRAALAAARARGPPLPPARHPPGWPASPAAARGASPEPGDDQFYDANTGTDEQYSDDNNGESNSQRGDEGASDGEGSSGDEYESGSGGEDSDGGGRSGGGGRRAMEISGGGALRRDGRSMSDGSPDWEASAAPGPMDIDQQDSESPRAARAKRARAKSGLPSGLAAKALPIRRPAMGTWLAPSDPSDCVLCQSSDCNKQTGPLAWVGHAGVCACLAVPLMPERQPPTWSGNAAANTVGTAGSNAAAAAAAGSGSQAAAAAGLAAPLAAAAAHSAATASSAAAPGAPTAPAAAAAGSGSNGSSGSEGSSSDNTLLAWDLLKWRVRTHGPCMSTVDYQPGCHVHTCGHMMHVKCAARYRADLQATAQQEPLFPGFQILNIARGHFLCPLCRRLSNCLLPAARFNWQPATASTAAAAAATAGTSQPQPVPQQRGYASIGGDTTGSLSQALNGLIAGLPQVGSTQIVNHSRAIESAAVSQGVSIPSLHGVDVPTNHRQGSTHEHAGSAPIAIHWSSSAPSAPAALRIGAAGAPAAGPSRLAVAAAAAAIPPASRRRSSDTAAAVAAAAAAGAAGPATGAAPATWSEVAEWAYADLSTIAVDLTHTVSNEGVKQVEAVDRAVEVRASMTVLEATAAETAAAATAAAAGAQDDGAAPAAPAAAAAAAGGSGELSAGSVQQSQQQPGAARAVLPALQPPAGVTPYLDPPIAAVDTHTYTLTHTGGLATLTALDHTHTVTHGLGPTQSVVGAGMGVGGGAGAGAGAGGAVGLAALVTEAGSSGSGGSSGAHANAMSAHATAGRVRSSGAGGGVHIAPGSGLQASVPLCAWHPCLSGETVGELRRRWKREPMGPVLWATLAHNIAHWEALRRPRHLLSGQPTLTHTDTPHPAPRHTHAHSRSPHQHHTSHSATGLPVIESAHINALSNVLQLCVALGTGSNDALAAAQQLRAAASWLLGANLGSCSPGLAGAAAAAAVGSAAGPSQPQLAGVTGQAPTAAAPHSTHTGLPSLEAPPPVPVCITAGLLSEYDHTLALQLLRAFFKQNEIPGLRVQCSRQATDMQQLLSDPFLLVLELFALSLTARGVQIQQGAGTATSLHGGGSAAHGISGYDASTAGLVYNGPSTPAGILTAVLRVLGPIVAVQAVAWLVGGCDGTETGSAAGGAAPAAEFAERVLRGAQEALGTVHEAAAARDAVAATLLPLLVRCYVLHSLLSDTKPAPDDPLILSYRSLTPPHTHPHAHAHTGHAASSTPQPATCAELASRLCARLGIPDVTGLLTQAVTHLTHTSHTNAHDSGHTIRPSSGLPMSRNSAHALVMRWTGHIAWAMGVPSGVPDGAAQQTAATQPATAAGPAAAAAAAAAAAISGVSAGGQLQHPATGASMGLASHGGIVGDIPMSHASGSGAIHGGGGLSGGLSGQHVSVWARAPSAWQCLRPAPHLISLPELFQDLFLPVRDKVGSHPALCLVTGRVLCSWWRGCQKSLGGGLLHAMEMCGGSNVMLSLGSTKAISLRPYRLAMCQSPYLDAHGEEDADLKRGRPLYLNEQMYRQLGSLYAASATEFDSHMLQSSRVDLVFL